MRRRPAALRVVSGRPLIVRKGSVVTQGRLALRRAFTVHGSPTTALVSNQPLYLKGISVMDTVLETAGKPGRSKTRRRAAKALMYTALLLTAIFVLAEPWLLIPVV